MHYIKKLKKTLVMLGTAMSLCSTYVSAHPHNWIDLSTQFNINKAGELTGFSQYWQFDQFFSMISYAELMNEYNDEKTGLAATALKMVANVGPDQYLSTLEIEGVRHELPVPELYTLELKDSEEAQILILKMTFTLKAPPLVNNKTISLKTYEPTYFIAMNYLSDAGIRINSNYLNCKADLIKANPSEELVYYANSLDRNVRETDGLGDEFAEEVRIKC
jgi:ABC-type uncharacterized transport system substrate-binding protein